tara:strand:- start:311 stop:823 length:513 start_codon:yes stop_codon:yes gene_type:complete
MKVVDIADEIFRETGSMDITSVAAISFWIRSNIGAMNNHLNTTFAVDDTTLEISYTDEDDVVISLNPEEVSILKQMYIVYDYDSKLRLLLGAASWDSVVEVSDAGTRVKKVNKSEMGKTLALTKKQEQEQLNKLISSYKMRESNPRQVAGDDTAEGKFPETPINRNHAGY